MNEWNRLCQKAKYIREDYPKGTKVILEHMEGENDMPSGLAGTVQFVDDIGQIHVKWENGRSLALNVEKDTFRVTKRPTKNKEEYSR